MTRAAWRARLAVLAWFVLLVAVIAGLRGAGTGQLAGPPLSRPGTWIGWLGGRDPVVAALAVVRLVALAAAWYVLATGVAGVVFRLLRAHHLAALADRVTPALVRRLLVAAVSVSVAAAGPGAAVFAGAAPATTVAAAAPGPSPTTPVTTGPVRTTPTMRLLAPGEAPPGIAVPTGGQAPASTTTPSTTTTTLATTAVTSGAPSASASASAPAPRPPSPSAAVVTTWTVKRGECFWSIAEDVLSGAWGRAVSDGEIVPYWRGLIEANRSSLVDRDNADLIYPGQVFTVPSPPSPSPPAS